MAAAAERYLSDLLERLYGQAGEGLQDRDAVAAQLARYVGGVHGQVAAGRLSTGAVSVAAMSELDAREFSRMLQEHGPLDPQPPSVLASAERIVGHHEIEPPGFNRHPIARDYLDRYKLRHMLCFPWCSDGDE